MNDASDGLDRAFGALADPTRRRILEHLGANLGSTTGQVVAGVPGLSRFAVMKHLEVLRRAGLVQTLPESRRRRHFLVERSLDEARAWLSIR
jgi:DNA-binding transcriptional ArsR family regulator